MKKPAQTRNEFAQRKPLEVVGIGEVLLDIFAGGDSTIGGAPLNVTFHLNQILQSLRAGCATMVSAVGADDNGQRIMEYLSNSGMDTSYLVREPQWTTGSALVFSHEGSAGFEIAQGVAWDHIQNSDRLHELSARACAIVFGSLAQRSSLSRNTIQEFVLNVCGERLYDVNLRRNTRSGIAGYSQDIVRRSLELATIAKLNEDEIEEVASLLALCTPNSADERRQWQIMSVLAKEYDLPVVALTRGARGALVLCGEERYQLQDSNLPSEKVHPVGAGDAFSAGLLLGRILGCEMPHCLALAEALANWVVCNVSATPTLTAEIRLELSLILTAALKMEVVLA